VPFLAQELVNAAVILSTTHINKDFQCPCTPNVNKSNKSVFYRHSLRIPKVFAIWHWSTFSSEQNLLKKLAEKIIVLIFQNNKKNITR
jgi:hypothetical protein